MNIFLSDPHNFGKRVKLLNNGLVHKPRSVFWEQLFLGESVLRQFLDTSLKSGSETPQFSLPLLEVSSNSIWEGQCGYLKLTAVTSLDSLRAFQIGCTIGLFAWFGVSDLHSENIIVGCNDIGNFIFTTVDIETVFDDLVTLGNSGIVEDLTVPAHVSGLNSTLKLMSSADTNDECAAAMCAGYLLSMDTLESNHESIRQIVNEYKDIAQQPIRVVLRKTKSYINYLNNCNKPLEFQIPPLPSEIEQLQRGDVPYFFRFPQHPNEIYYFESPQRYVLADLGPDFCRLSLSRRRKFGSGDLERADGFTSLKKVGTLQLARAIARSLGRPYMKSTFLNCTVTMTNERILIQYGTDVRLTSKIA